MNNEKMNKTPFLIKLLVTYQVTVKSSTVEVAALT